MAKRTRRASPWLRRAGGRFHRGRFRDRPPSTCSQATKSLTDSGPRQGICCGDHRVVTPMDITGSLTISPRLCLLTAPRHQCAPSSSNWRTWKGSAAIDCSDTPGASCISPGNSGGISQCSLQSLRPMRKSCCARWDELCGAKHRRMQVFHQRLQVGHQRLRPRRRQHASGAADEQRVVKHLAQPFQRPADSRLAKMQHLCGTGDAPFAVQHHQDCQQIQIDTTKIIFLMILFIMIINLNVGYPGSIVNITPINQPAQCARRE